MFGGKESRFLFANLLISLRKSIGKSFTKNVSKKEEFRDAVRDGTKRRTRCWPTPHAKFAISPCCVPHRSTRKLSKIHAAFILSAFVACTFFASSFKTPLRNPPISEENAF
jgi:hypothetical protein